MRFDPKIVDDGESEFDDSLELELPDDLAALGRHLESDAADLARRYPCDENTIPGRSARSNVRRRLAWTAAAVAVILLTVTAGPLWRSVLESPTAVEEMSVADHYSNVAPSVVVHEPEPTGELLDTVPVLYPATFLQDVSGPELEGVLDLIEHEATDEEGLSI